MALPDGSNIQVWRNQGALAQAAAALQTSKTARRRGETFAWPHTRPSSANLLRNAATETAGGSPLKGPSENASCWRIATKRAFGKR